MDDKDGNKSFSAESGEALVVENETGANAFGSTTCCTTSTAAGFELNDTTGTAFKTDSLPTTLTLKDFDLAYLLLGDCAGPAAPRAASHRSEWLIRMESCRSLCGWHTRSSWKGPFV